MTTTMTIDKFNALLNSDREENDIVKMLRQIARGGSPKDVRLLKSSQSSWVGWAS